MVTKNKVIFKFFNGILIHYVFSTYEIGVHKKMIPVCCNSNKKIILQIYYYFWPSFIPVSKILHVNMQNSLFKICIGSFKKVEGIIACAEFAYNITSSQRVSIMYGSIQGGLFCSNGICRIIPPFNDGLKVSYSASF